MLISIRSFFLVTVLGMIMLAGCSRKSNDPQEKILGAWKQTAYIQYKSNSPIGEGKRTDMKSDWVRDFLPGGVIVSEGIDNIGDKKFEAFQLGKWDLISEGHVLMVSSENIYASHQAWATAGMARFAGDKEPELRIFRDGGDMVLTRQPGDFEPKLLGLWLEKGQAEDTWKKAEVFTHSGLNVTFIKEGKKATHRITRCTVEGDSLRQVGIRPKGDFQRTFTISADELTLLQDGETTIFQKVTDMPDGMARTLTH